MGGSGGGGWVPPAELEVAARSQMKGSAMVGGGGAL